MKKIAFIVLPEKGHINPYIGPAQALTLRGHTVVFASNGNIANQIGRAGLTFDNSLTVSKLPEQPTRGKELVELIQDPKSMRAWVRSLLLQVDDDAIQNQIQFMQYFKPDVLVLDPLYYSAVIAAEILNIPWVSMSNSLNPVLESEVESDLLQTVDSLQIDRKQLFGHYGIEMEFSGCDALSKYLTIAFCTEDFVGPGPLNVQMVGPSWPIESRGDETDIKEIPAQPFVYVSFGSQIYHWPEIFKRIIKATEKTPYNLVVSAGELADELRSEAPAHVQIYHYAPQRAILRKACAFITHGGANSVMEALALKTPMWVTPMCNDQFHQAHYVKKTGVGIVRDIRGLSIHEIRETLENLIQNQEIRTNVEKVWCSYQRDGACESAVLIERLL